MKIGIRFLRETAKRPERMSEHSAGYDIYADIIEDIYLHPMQRIVIPTGFAISLPTNCEAQIRPRSGLAVEHGITVLNSPGTIDSDYRGEVKVILINLSEEVFVIKNGMRIAQMVLSQHESVHFEIVDELDETKRGTCGFGSTAV